MPPWLETFLTAFIPLFVAIDPIGLIPVYLGMAQGVPQDRRNVVANEAAVTALLIAVGFLFLGNFIFNALGITVNDFRVAASDRRDADARTDFGVVPLGMPIIAGPAMLTALLTLDSLTGRAVTLIALLVNLLLVLVALRAATFFQRVLGLRAMRAVSKIVALLLAAIAVNLVRRGLAR